MSAETMNVLIAAIGIFAGGGGVWGYLKAKEDKVKTPYDMMIDLLQEQKKFYQERNADYEREKLDSAEKSAVIQQTHKCKLKYADPSVSCPVDLANEKRLNDRCERCGYGEKEDS